MKSERDVATLKKQVTARRSEMYQIECAIKVLTPDLLIATRHARSKSFLSGNDT